MVLKPGYLAADSAYGSADNFARMVKEKGIAPHIPVFDKSNTLTLHPALDDEDFHRTMTELGISMTIATLLIMKIKAKTDVWDEFQTLLRRYRALASERHRADQQSQQEDNT